MQAEEGLVYVVLELIISEFLKSNLTGLTVLNRTASTLNPKSVTLNPKPLDP